GGALGPGQPIEVTKVRQWLADLNSEEFSTRDKASRQLAQLGEDVESELRKALEGKPTLEVRRRIERLIQSFPQSPTPEMRRALRSVMILEMIDSADARPVLVAL